MKKKVGRLKLEEKLFAPCFSPVIVRHNAETALAFKFKVMSYVKIWIHAVWTVKNREPVISQEKKKILFEHIHKNALEKEILMEVVCGYNNHVHCLFRLKNDQTIEKVMQLIKGESSFWFNKNTDNHPKLIWQKEHFAVSVSESQVNAV
ncbi:transposase [uncultured Draconibacterium sp.]|uniref:transposase n=1 Tax=uncultured Draconibacterium sp. TaxID=1573823 RepID=UPI003217F7C7